MVPSHTQARGRNLQSAEIPDFGHAVCVKKFDMQMQQAGNNSGEAGGNNSPFRSL